MIRTINSAIFSAFLLATISVSFIAHTEAFSPAITTAARTSSSFNAKAPAISNTNTGSRLYQNTIHKVPEDDDTPIPFIEPSGSGFVECYADSIVTVDGVEYTIGNPCDTSVALCYFDKYDNLIPIDLDSDLMDEIFPLAATIVEDEFGEELALERTPQTLTLVGELEEGEDDEEDEEDEDEEYGDSDSEEVEILISFEEEDIEYCLVRLLDPVLLVGKSVEGEDQKCYLLTPAESDKIMPAVEKLFLEAQEETA